MYIVLITKRVNIFIYHEGFIHYGIHLQFFTANVVLYELVSAES